MGFGKPILAHAYLPIVTKHKTTFYVWLLTQERRVKSAEPSASKGAEPRLKLPSDLGQKEAYNLLFQRFVRKRRRWNVRSSKEPSLIVVSTGIPLPSRVSNLAGGLAKIAIESKGRGSEIDFSFDFKMWYFSHFVFELIVAYVLFGVIIPKYLEPHSLYAIPIIGLFAFGLFFIPWFSRNCVRNTERRVITESRIALRK